MNDAERERIIDRAVQRRLATDRAYRNAENAEQQQQREDAITAQEERRIDAASAWHTATTWRAAVESWRPLLDADPEAPERTSESNDQVAGQ